MNNSDGSDNVGFGLSAKMLPHVIPTRKKKVLVRAIFVLLFLGCIISVTLAVIMSRRELDDQKGGPDSRAAANFYDMSSSSTPGLISLGVRGYQQTTDYSCGPSSVMSLLNWYGVLSDDLMNNVTEARLISEMGTNSEVGTSPEKMSAWLSNNGFISVVRTDGTIEELIGYLSRGIPIIIDWIDWGGHWVVLTGSYEADNEADSTFFFADPAAHWTWSDNPDGITSFSTVRFYEMWFDANSTTGEVVYGTHIVAVPKDAQDLRDSLHEW
jgi:hypothetical protein